MTDIVSPEVRSRMMAGIRGKNTRLEVRFRRALHAAGYRYRLHVRSLPGSPDLVLAKYSAVCFVHGCYWHRHPGCSYATTPATRTAIWTEKFRANIERDRRQQEKLLAMGWRVAIVWECSLRRSAAASVAECLAEWLHGEDPVVEIE